jgi:hypothetical protein
MMVMMSMMIMPIAAVMMAFPNGRWQREQKTHR